MNRLIIAALAAALCVPAQAQTVNRQYEELPLGSISPDGWLREMLVRQKNGITADLDKLYPQVMGQRNGWLGGDGDQWERGPYWIDGLLPLAYILDDDALKAKVQPWVEWALASQKEDGYFGPDKDYPYEKGLQRTWCDDWWPRMVVLKVLHQYYNATGDERVITFMKNYFAYQYRTLPEKPLGFRTYWAEFREGDNLNEVIWLYRKTGEQWLLDLANLLHGQGYDFTKQFLETDFLTVPASIHGVNLAQGLKEPVIYSQINSDPKYRQAVRKGLEDIRHFDGFVNGMFGGDELLHGNNPTNGAELCSVVELMYSLEEMIKVTGGTEYADLLERIAFNALPTQTTDDFTARQYFQQANQVMITRHLHNFDINHGNTDLVYGLLSGYPCCTSNMHQGWPKFTQNLWLSTYEGGLAAMYYAPCTLDATVNGKRVTITEETFYPMDGKIVFTVSPNRGSVSFPLQLRIPSWCHNASYTVDDVTVDGLKAGDVITVDRTWKKGDALVLNLPMELSSGVWYENSRSVEYGPLVFALGVREKWVKKYFEKDSIYGPYYWEVLPLSDWNYGLMNFDLSKDSSNFEVRTDPAKLGGDWYWNLDGAPVSIKVKAKKIPSWTLYNEMAGPLPYSHMCYGPDVRDLPVETIELVPYGCTTLRISEFPIID